jgi:hypothetical protein
LHQPTGTATLYSNMDARVTAAERILDRGVRFLLPASFFQRLFRLNRIEIHPLKGGTILEFSRVVILAGLEDSVLKGDWTFLEKSIEPVARCVAISILNDEDKIRKNADKLSKKLLWNLPAGTLVEIFRTISELNRVSDFMNITRFYVSQMTMMMNPRNLGQEKGGR